MSWGRCAGAFSSHGPVMIDTLAQVLVGRVIGEPSKFVLDGLGEVRVLDDGILSHFAREFRVEVCNVQHGFLKETHETCADIRPRGGLTYDTGLERWLNLLCHQSIPIDVPGEERMPLDLVTAVITQPPLRIPLQQSGHHTPCFRGDIRREVERVGEDPLVHDVDVLVVKRRQACHHLIDQHTESPPVDSLGISLAFEEFRGNVFWRATEGYGSAIRLAIRR